MMRKATAALFAVTCLLPLNAIAAEHYTYNISAAGFPIGQATVDINQDGKNYDMAMSTEFGGIVALFTGAKATVISHGLFENSEVRNTNTDGVIQWGKKIRNAKISFDEMGDVTDLYVKPKYSYPSDERHPLDKETLKQVKDPLSAMYRPLKYGQLDCTVRLRVFDSKERYDLQFSPTKHPMRCMVQPIPISGYRLSYDKKGGEPKPLEVTFAVTPDGQHAVPARLERDMLVGWLVIEREDFAKKKKK